MSLHFLMPKPAPTALPDGDFSTVAPDNCLGYYLFGRDNAYSARNRRPDHAGLTMSTFGAPAIDEDAGAVFSAGNYFNTGIREREVMTFMAVAQITGAIDAAPTTSYPFLIGTGRGGALVGANLVRTNVTWRFNADYDVAGAPSHSENADATIGSGNVTICCLFGQVKADLMALYDMTRPEWFEEQAPPAGAAGRYVSNNTINIGAIETAPFRGPIRMWAAGIWDVWLTPEQRAEQYAQVKALLGGIGVAF